jgi:hypothetical protein
METKKDSALFISKGDSLIAICHLDQKTHHNVFYKVEMMGADQIAELLGEKVTV